MSFEGVLHHGESPPFQLQASRVNPVVDCRDRQAKEGSDVLVRAFVNEEQCRSLTQRHRELPDCPQRGGELLAFDQSLIGCRASLGTSNAAAKGTVCKRLLRSER